jgi:hypothetical protein
MNKAIRIGIDQGPLLVWILNSCCLDHDMWLWIVKKGIVLGNKKENEGKKRKEDRKLKIKVWVSRGTWSKKP